MRHRPRKLPLGWPNEDDERCIAAKGALSGQIDALARLRGVVDFYSGMADGTDVWAALAVLELKERHPGIRLHCIIPHPGQADRWPRPAQERYHSILDKADDVEVINPRSSSDCMMKRNRYMVDAAGYVLAVYDGTGGGTASTLAYAKQLGREIIIVDPVARVVRHPIRD